MSVDLFINPYIYTCDIPAVMEIAELRFAGLKSLIKANAPSGLSTELNIFLNCCSLEMFLAAIKKHEGATPDELITKTFTSLDITKEQFDPEQLSKLQLYIEYFAELAAQM